MGEVPGLWKADIDAAFRRIPVRPEHRWACGIAFMVGKQVCLIFFVFSVVRCLWLISVSLRFSVRDTMLARLVVWLRGMHGNA